MRVGLVIYDSIDSLSGGYLYDRMLVERLKANGDQVEIVSLPGRSYLAHLGDNFSVGLHRGLQELPVDLLLQDELNHPSLWWINRLLQGEEAYPIVSIVHHLRCSEARPAWQNRLYAWVESRYLASVNAFIFNSQTTRQVVEKLAGIGKPSVVAYPGGDRLRRSISEAQIVARANDPGPLRIFFLGNLIPRKGLHILIQALLKLPRKSWRLAVAGSLVMDRAYTGAVMRQVKAARLEEQVQFLGPLGDAELAQQLVLNQVMVVPSSYEGFGIAYIEGMGFGLPAIATRRGAASEIITPGENGYLVAPDAPGGLAERLEELAEDRGRLARLSLGARQRFEAHPTWEQTTESIRDFLVQMI
jgi:glycosyltransferase involved in cell wall biosynthesis